MTSPRKIFISYTRRDQSGIDTAASVDRELRKAGFDVWRDAERLSVGDNWSAEIEKQVRDCSVLIAVISQSYSESEICRAEHILALNLKQRVLPLLVQATVQIPLHLVPKQYLDWSRAQSPTELIEALAPATSGILETQLREEFRGRRPNVTHARRPDHFVSRSEDLDQLKKLVLSPDPAGVSSLVEIFGEGGIGKSALTVELASDPCVAAAFPDGVVWLPIGSEPHIPGLLGEAAGTFGRQFGDYSSESSAYKSFCECVRDKAALIILDDVRSVEHVHRFRPLDDAEAPRLKIVYTCRKTFADSLPARRHQLGPLPPKLARQLLSMCVNNSDLPPEADALLSHYNGHPLALRLLGARLNQGIRYWDSTIAWQDALELLTSGKLDAAIQEIIRSTANLLQETARERYLDLAVFSDKTPIPLTLLSAYWDTNDIDARTTIGAWLDLSLAEKLEGGFIRLHDLQMDYVKAERMASLPGLHASLVRAYKRACALTDRRRAVVLDEIYFGKRLAYHMSMMGGLSQLRALLLSYDWIRSRCQRNEIAGLIGDYDLLPDDPDVQLVCEALTLSSHLLLTNPRLLAGQLAGRLLFVESPAIRELLDAARRTETASWLEPIQQSMIPVGGPLLRTFQGHTDEVTSVSVSGDGALAVSGSVDCTVRIWDLKRNEEVRVLRGHASAVNGVAVTSDGSRAVSVSSAEESAVRLWNLDSGNIVWTSYGHIGSVRCVALTPDAQYAISGSSDMTLRVWDLKDGKLIRILEGHTGKVWAVATGRRDDGVFVLSGSADNTVKVWDFASGMLIRTLEGHVHEVRSVAVSPDGRRALSGSVDETAKIWDLPSGGLLGNLQGHSGRVASVAFTPDGKRGLTGAWDNTIRLWNLLSSAEAEKPLRILNDHSSTVAGLTVTPDGERALSASFDETVKLWDLDRENVSHTPFRHADWVIGATSMQDGIHAISGSSHNWMRLWSLESGSVTGKLKVCLPEVSALALTPDGKNVMAATAKRATIKLWDLQSGKGVNVLAGHSSLINSLAFSQDNRRAISGSDDGTAKLWDLETGTLICTLQGHTGSVRSVAIVPDGKRALSASRDQTVILWSMESGTVIRTFAGHTKPVTSVMALPDGVHAISGSDDFTIKLWNLDSGSLIRTLEGHSDSVASLAVSSDGKRALSGSNDATLALWDLETGSRLAAFGGESGIVSCCFTPNEGLYIAGEQSGRVHFLKLMGTHALENARERKTLSRTSVKV